jgi:hypothetical protein
MINRLKFTETGGIKKAVIGKGYFAIGEDMDALLQVAGIQKETMNDKGLQFVRRKNTDGYTYFINNRTNKQVNEWIGLTRKASSVAMFDATTGKSGLATWRTANNGSIEVMAQLKPDESIIVQTFNTKKSGSNYPYINTTGKPQRIKGDWAVTFIEGGPALPSSYKTSQLSSWTEQEGEAYKYFSGSAKYSISFAKPEGTAAAWLLDLGKVMKPLK